MRILLEIRRPEGGSIRVIVNVGTLGLGRRIRSLLGLQRGKEAIALIYKNGIVEQYIPFGMTPDTYPDLTLIEETIT